MRIIRLLVLVLAVLCVGVAGVESVARPLALQPADLSGVYSGGGMKVELVADGTGYSGQIHFNNQVFPLSARAAGAGLEGTFRAGEHAFPFTAEVSGGTMTFRSGGNTYTLAREAPAAPAPPPAPPNPLAGTPNPIGQPPAQPTTKPSLAALADMGPVRQNPKRDWLILIYMAADNNLEPFAISDMNEIEEGLPAEGTVEVVVLVDRHKEFDTSDGDWTDTRVYRMVRDDTPAIRSEVIARPGELNTGDPAVLEAFIAASIKTFPARRHALVMWNHGGGWASMASDEDAPGAEGGHAHLDIMSMRSAVAAGLGRAGLPKFNIIGFDMCLMGQLEIAVELEGLADIMIASEELEAGDGWPYAAFLPVFARQMVASRRLSQEIVHAFDEFYKTHPGGKHATLSSLDLAMVPEVIKALDELAAKLESGLEHSWSDVSRALFYSQNYGGPGDLKQGRAATASIDVLDFFKRVRFALEGGAEAAVTRLGGAEAVRQKAAESRSAALSGSGLPEWDATAQTPSAPQGSPQPPRPVTESPPVRRAPQQFNAEQEFNAFRDVMDRFIVSTRSSKLRTLSNGVAFYAPLHGDMFNERYGETRLARDSRWAGFLAKVHDHQNRFAVVPSVSQARVVEEQSRKDVTQVRNLGGYTARCVVEGRSILWTTAIQGARTPQGLFVLKKFIVNDPWWLTKQRDLPPDSASLSMPEYPDGRTELMHELQGLRYLISDGRSLVAATVDRSDYLGQDLMIVPALVTIPGQNELMGRIAFNAQTWRAQQVIVLLPQPDGRVYPVSVPRLPPETVFQPLFEVIGNDGSITYAQSDKLTWGNGLELVLGMDDPREYEIAFIAESVGGKTSTAAVTRYTVVNDPELERSIAQAGRFRAADLLGDWKLEAQNEQPTFWQVHPIPDDPDRLIAIVVRGEKQVGRILLWPDTRVLPNIRARWINDSGDEIAFFTFTSLLGRANDGGEFLILKDSGSALQIQMRKVGGRQVAQGPQGQQGQPAGAAREFRHASGLVFGYPAAWSVVDGGDTLQILTGSDEQATLAVNIAAGGAQSLTQEAVQAADMVIRQNLPFLQLAAQPEVLQTAGGQGVALRYQGHAQGTAFSGTAYLTIQKGLTLVLFGLGEANAYAQIDAVAGAIFQTFRVEGGQPQPQQQQQQQQQQGRIDLTGVWRGDDGTILAFDAQNWELYDDDELQDRGTYAFNGSTLSVRSAGTGMAFNFRVTTYTARQFTVLDEDGDPVIYTKVR